jgi:hypothetical protein
VTRQLMLLGGVLVSGVLAASLLAQGGAGGQGGAAGARGGPAPAVDRQLMDAVLNGAIDVHAHADPDNQPRPLDVVALARLAKARGMRGFVFKQHLTQTATLAAMARELVPGIDVFGGIALNRAVGGMNPVAIEFMANVKGGWGRMVWMPTVDTEEAGRRANRAFVAVTKDGAVLPETRDVLALIARTRTRDSNGELVLATGHLPAPEALVVLHEAKRLGVAHMIVTHPASSWTPAQLKEASDLGAFIEFQAQILSKDPAGPEDTVRARQTAVLKLVGPANAIISTDLGQPANSLHPDGLVLAARWLRTQGFTDQDLNRMMKENPVRLLGLAART